MGNGPTVVVLVLLLKILQRTRRHFRWAVANKIAASINDPVKSGASVLCILNGTMHETNALVGFMSFCWSFGGLACLFVFVCGCFILFDCMVVCAVCVCPFPCRSY